MVCGEFPNQRCRNYPKGWIVTRPNTDTNKEAGTVSTGDYGRGDSAALFVTNKSLIEGSNLSDKDTVGGVIKKALAQKVRQWRRRMRARFESKAQN